MSTPCTCGASGSGGASLQSKKLLKRISTNKGDQETNPYSGRGFEKFSALLAEIEEKKLMVYSQFDPEEVSLIWFVHASDNKLKPVIVRANSSKHKVFKPRKTTKMEEEIGAVVVHEEDAGEEKKVLLVLVLVLVLVVLLLFGRYYLLQLQDAVCPNIQT